VCEATKAKCKNSDPDMQRRKLVGAFGQILGVKSQVFSDAT